MLAKRQDWATLLHGVKISYFLYSHDNLEKWFGLTQNLWNSINFFVMLFLEEFLVILNIKLTENILQVHEIQYIPHVGVYYIYIWKNIYIYVT